VQELPVPGLQPEVPHPEPHRVHHRRRVRRDPAQVQYR
jgi:hypothetical protein